MRFTPSQARAVLDGRQTMIHVIARESRTASRPNGTEYETQPFVPKIGARLPFRYSSPLPNDAADHTERAFIIITDCPEKPMMLGRVVEDDAKAAGHHGADAYRQWWVRQHDKAWVERLEKRERDAHRDPARFLPTYLRVRFAERHYRTLVWPVTFRLDESEIPVFMLPAARGGPADDDVLAHTSSRARALDDVELFDVERVDPAWRERSERRRVEARGERETHRQIRSVIERLRQNLLAAQRAGTDLDPHLAKLAAAAAEIESDQAAAA